MVFRKGLLVSAALVVLIGSSCGSGLSTPKVSRDKPPDLDGRASQQQSSAKSGTTQTPDSDSVTLSTISHTIDDDIRAYLDDLADIYRKANVPVLGIDIVPLDPGTESEIARNRDGTGMLPYIGVQVPAVELAPPESIFLFETICRLSVVAVWQGVPVRNVALIGVSGDGTKTQYAIAVIDGASTIPAPSWRQPPRLSMDDLRADLEHACARAARDAKLSLEPIRVVEEVSGRVVTVVGSAAGAASVSESLDVFSRLMESSIRGLNEQGGKISGLNVTVKDEQQTPAGATGQSFMVGGGMKGRWVRRGT